MRFEDHCRNSRKSVGVEGADIHKWLDAFARAYSQTFYGYEYTTFEHRKFRHHKEGIEEAVEEFKDKYPADIVRKVCESHLRDDYDGYVPVRKDFEDPEFIRKYH